MINSSSFEQVGSRDVDRRESTLQQMEQDADEILKKPDRHTRTYTEKQLARKIRLEDRRMTVVDETSVPAVVVDYLLAGQLKLMVETARLTKLQAAVLGFSMLGWTTVEMAYYFDISPIRVKRARKSAQRRISRGGSPYDGLYEVYWSEVRRYVYRKHTSRGGR